jgi:hypothetical protein
MTDRGPCVSLPGPARTGRWKPGRAAFIGCSGRGGGGSGGGWVIAPLRDEPGLCFCQS